MDELNLQEAEREGYFLCLTRSGLNQDFIKDVIDGVVFPCRNTADIDCLETMQKVSGGRKIISAAAG